MAEVGGKRHSIDGSLDCLLAGGLGAIASGFLGWILGVEGYPSQGGLEGQVVLGF
jgi:hypothetical protein